MKATTKGWIGVIVFTLFLWRIAGGASSGVGTSSLDGDGDVDILSGSAYDDKVAWYENDGSQGFTAHVITVTADYASSVFAIDLDRDGDMDVLSTSAQDDKVAWYENIGKFRPGPDGPE
jgi:hypothetical protein